MVSSLAGGAAVPQAAIVETNNSDTSKNKTPGIPGRCSIGLLNKFVRPGQANGPAGKIGESAGTD
jgi:hypothetical protein